MKGLVIGGEFDKIIVRQKSGQTIELGEILVADMSTGRILLECFDVVYGNQIQQQHLELVSGMKLEDGHEIKFIDPELRSYTLAFLKPVLFLGTDVQLCKSLPEFFASVRAVEQSDVEFMSRSSNPMRFGTLRSGSTTLDVAIDLDGTKVLGHHILIAGTTGRGKSVLMKNLLWNTIDAPYCGMLVLDPHDEYFGRNALGLKDHTVKPVYYTTNPFPGAVSLQIHLHSLRPSHFNGVLRLSDPQRQAFSAYYRHYGKAWVEAIVLDKPLDVSFHEGTLAVVRRLMLSTLGIEMNQNQVFAEGVFSYKSGYSTVSDICRYLEQAKTVIIDTSNFPSHVELLIGSLIVSELFRLYKRYKVDGVLIGKPVVSVVIEEAPRVLGKDVLEHGSNIFSTVAREGRKFQVGLIAITQLPSLIPRQVLANMNTKIILGIEMGPERQAIIESASQDLSRSNRTIASLDRGEAIITSSFSKFAIPLKIPLFEKEVKNKEKISFGGMV